MRLFSANASLFLKSECSISCMCHFTDSMIGLLGNVSGRLKDQHRRPFTQYSMHPRSNALGDEEEQEHEEADVISTGLRQT